jgi:N-acetylmuramic acid 6-phosphate (MurNAc-6-P) etherase
MAVSFSEAPNPISANIDVASSSQQAWTLRQADALMLLGWEGHPGLLSRTFIKALGAAVVKAGEALSRGGAVILSGAGSSGRLAAHAAAAFNRLLPPATKGRFMYTIAGGDGAIVKSAEALEDSPTAALHDMQHALSSLPAAASPPPCVLVGITCGLSATYVGAQLEHALASQAPFPVLIGFNPVERARDVVIPAWGKSFKQVALSLARAEEEGRACLLNPVVGPEVVTGSTRMKSGSVTKIILEILCSLAISYSGTTSSSSPSASLSVHHDIEFKISHLLNLYSSVIASAYASTELSLPSLISISSQFLRGDSSVSDCPPAAPSSAGRIFYASDATCAGATHTPTLLPPPSPPFHPLHLPHLLDFNPSPSPISSIPPPPVPLPS